MTEHPDLICEAIKAGRGKLISATPPSPENPPPRARSWFCAMVPHLRSGTHSVLTACSPARAGGAQALRPTQVIAGRLLSPPPPRARTAATASVGRTVGRARAHSRPAAGGSSQASFFLARSGGAGRPPPPRAVAAAAYRAGGEQEMPERSGGGREGEGVVFR
jgi:hypothetical protein